MFVYCENCNWTQDGFWHEGYNPYDFMCNQGNKDLLFSGKLEEVFMIEKNDRYAGYIGNQPMTNREFLTKQMRHWANRIENQRWITIEDYKKENPEGMCPNCKRKTLIED